jgi:hypothetical protein
MSLSSSFTKLVVYGSFWFAIVGVCGVIGAIAGSIGVPDTVSDLGGGLRILAFGFRGVLIGMLVGTVAVLYIYARREGQDEDTAA